MKSLKVLVACEESQRVCAAFRKRGHEAYSCDIIEPSGGHPEWHIMGDVLKTLNPSSISLSFYGIIFKTMDGQAHRIKGTWDLIIAHPPCTYLTVSGNRWFNIDRYGDKAIERVLKREEAARFFLKFAGAFADHIAIENPVGYMNSFWRKPDQIIQPFEFGHKVRKKTCLWLKGLPKLIPTNIVKPDVKPGGFSGAAYYAKDENGKILRWNDPQTAKIRSKTFEGIAEAMAEQWGAYLSEGRNENET